MKVIDQLRHADGGRAIGNLARSYGISHAEADAAVAALTPLLAERIERNTLSRGGLADLIAALGDGRHAAYGNGQLPLNDPRLVNDGNRILGHLLGTKDASRGVAARAASTSGLSEGLLKMLLPIIAGMIMNGLGKSTQGGLGDILSKMGLPGFPGAGEQQPMPRSGGQPQMPRSGQRGGGGYGMPELPQMPGGGAGLPMPGDEPREEQRDDNPFGRSGQSGQQDGGFGLPLPGGRGGTAGGWPSSSGRGAGLPMPDEDDQTGNPWRLPSGNQRPMGDPSNNQGSPLPLPGDTIPSLPRNSENPYGDLSDILRRGGFGGGSKSAPGGSTQVPLPIPTNMGGGMLWSLVRSILGGALGFGNRGIFGWIINFIVMRFGWTILRTIFGRMIPGMR